MTDVTLNKLLIICSLIPTSLGSGGSWWYYYLIGETSLRKISVWENLEKSCFSPMKILPDNIWEELFFICLLCFSLKRYRASIIFNYNSNIIMNQIRLSGEKFCRAKLFVRGNLWWGNFSSLFPDKVFPDKVFCFPKIENFFACLLFMLHVLSSYDFRFDQPTLQEWAFISFKLIEPLSAEICTSI